MSLCFFRPAPEMIDDSRSESLFWVEPSLAEAQWDLLGEAEHSTRMWLVAHLVPRIRFSAEELALLWMEYLVLRYNFGLPAPAPRLIPLLPAPREHIRLCTGSRERAAVIRWMLFRALLPEDSPPGLVRWAEA